MRVLVVDDSSAVRSRLMALIGERAGVEVDGVATAEAALEALAERRYGAVVLDLHLPRHEGPALIDTIKARAPATVVIVLTNDAGEQQRRACLARGADYFLDKSHEFNRAVEIALAGVAAPFGG